MSMATQIPFLRRRGQSSARPATAAPCRSWPVPARGWREPRPRRLPRSQTAPTAPSAPLARPGSPCRGFTRRYPWAHGYLRPGCDGLQTTGESGPDDFRLGRSGTCRGWLTLPWLVISPPIHARSELGGYLRHPEVRGDVGFPTFDIEAAPRARNAKMETELPDFTATQNRRRRALMTSRGSSSGPSPPNLGRVQASI